MIEPGRLLLAVRASLVLMVALVLQVGVVANLRIAGVEGDVMLLVGLAVGIAGGSERGATFGFAAGLVYDLVLQTPFGLSALVYVVVGYAAGLTRDAFLRDAWWIAPGTALVGSVAGVILYAVSSTVVGQSVAGLPLFRIVVVVALVNAVLARPASRLARWTIGADPVRGRMVLR